MARRGRDVELLVEQLEKLLADYPVEIKSPEYVIGKNSKSRREIDVSVHGKVGSSNIFVILECRKRSAKDDVKWIGELASKREDVGADKAIAISSSGFTKGAANLADKHQILLRTIQQLAPDTFFEWYQAQILYYANKFFDIKAVSLLIDPQFGISNEEINTSVEDVAIFVKATQQKITLIDIFNSISHIDPAIWNDIKFDSSKTQKTLTVVSDSVSQFQLKYVNALIDVKQIIMTVDLWIQTSPHPVDNKLSIYQNHEGNDLVQIVEATLKIPTTNTSNETVKLTYHRIVDTKETYIAIESNKPVQIKFHDVTPKIGNNQDE